MPEPVWVDDDELCARAWLLCCRHVGIARPVGLSSGRVDAFDRADVAKGISDAFVRISVLGVVSNGHREWVDEVAARFNGELRAALTPAINELTMIGDLLEAIDGMRERASACVTEIVRRTHTGERLVNVAPDQVQRAS